MSFEIRGPQAANPGQKTASTGSLSGTPAASQRPQPFAEVLRQTQSISGPSSNPAAPFSPANAALARPLSPTSPAASWPYGAVPSLAGRLRVGTFGYLFSTTSFSSRTPNPSGILPQSSAVTTPPVKSLGTLSARFESGSDGVAAIGYDTHGGTSYGTYQISSRAGTMERFLGYLEDRAPEWARQLRAAGPANTGSRGGAMPEAWRTIAARDPRRFAQLQHDFIKQTHYVPALQDIAQRTGVNLAQAPQAVQEMLWSTAVQHGARGAASIFCAAIEAQGLRPGGPVSQDLITSVYAARARKFGLSSPETQAAVQRRFQEERNLALSMFTRTPGKAEKLV